jgi:hypothetical protein
VEQADPTGGVGLRLAHLSSPAFVELKDPVLPRSIFSLTYKFSRVLDTRAEPEVLTEAGFQASSFFADDYGSCPELAEWAAASGFEALLAPSAAWRFPDGLVCAVFPPGRNLLLRKDVVVAAARPTVTVAAATTYKAGERPSWL